MNMGKGKVSFEKKHDAMSRWWTCILYPESCKSDFREILNSKNIDWVCSPLHDKDINELDNELKKAHYHLLFSFNKNGSTRESQANKLSTELGGTLCQPVHDLINATKYLIHLNNPEKYQYSKNDITCGTYTDLTEILKLTKSEERKLSIDIVNFIYQNQVGYFHELILYFSTNDFEKYDYIIQHSYFFSMLCKSINAKLREMQTEK